MPDSTCSVLLDLSVTFAGVLGAQLLSNFFQNRHEVKVRRQAAERLREQVSKDLQLALTAVKKAREVLTSKKMAPEVRPYPGTLTTHRFEVVEICMGDTDRVAEFMVAQQSIELLNKRLDSVEDLDLRELHSPTSSKEHTMQVADAIKKSERLQAHLESLLAFVDPESATEWGEKFRGG